MAIKHRLKGIQDKSNLKKIKAAKVDHSAATAAKRRKAKAYRKKNQFKIKAEAAKRRRRMTPSDKVFAKARRAFLKRIKPLAPPKPKPPSKAKPKKPAKPKAIKPAKPKAIKPIKPRVVKPRVAKPKTISKIVRKSPVKRKTTVRRSKK